MSESNKLNETAEEDTDTPSPLDHTQLVPLSVLHESFRYFSQRHIITNTITNEICDWLLKEDFLNTHKLKFATFFFKKFLLQEVCAFYNLEDINVTRIDVAKDNQTEENWDTRDNQQVNSNLWFCKKYKDDYNDSERQLIAILCISDNIFIHFEDLQIVNLKKGSVLVFFNDVRFLIFDHSKIDTHYITFSFTGTAKSDKMFNEWWILDKKNDSRYRFSIPDFST
jgi:hypothetical protein